MSTDPERREAIASALEEIARYMEILGENDFKVRAYSRGAEAVRAASERIEDIAAGAVKVAGVGEGLRTAIAEYLATGRIAARDELAAKVPQGVIEILTVPGLGPKKAMAIHRALGVASLGELEYACRENRLVTLKGFGQAMQDKILKGLEQIRLNAGKHRFDEAQELAGKFGAELRRKVGNQAAAVVAVGELGRRLEVVETIELHVAAPEPDLAREAARNFAWAEGSPAEERVGALGVELASLSGKLADGSALRIWVGGSAPDARLFRWLCAPPAARAALERSADRLVDWEPTWIEPRWIDAGRAPTPETYRRARDGGVRGIFHCHTDFSDGSATLQQMVSGAERLGYEYIGVSDHSQSAVYAQGLKPDRLREQARLVRELQKQVSIRIFHGVESDILADGALDYAPDVLGELDFVIGSVHSRFQMDEAAMTERLVRALENPYTTIWGHPTGRLVLGRKGYSLDWERCLRAAVAGGVAVEINANPQRLDVDWSLGAELDRFGAMVAVDPDAHAVEGIADTIYGEYVAEKAMLPRGRILNLMPVDKMERHLADRKKRAGR